MILPVMSEDGLIQYNELRIHALAKIKRIFCQTNRCILPVMSDDSLIKVYFAIYLSYPQFRYAETEEGPLLANKSKSDKSSLL